jgi:uncharacterized RDD family membrane protein YckC
VSAKDDDPFGRGEEPAADPFGREEKERGGDDAASGWLPPEPAGEAPPSGGEAPGAGTPPPSGAPEAAWAPPSETTTHYAGGPALDYGAALPGGRSASWGSRLGAAVIDWLIRLVIAAPFVGLWLALGGTSEADLYGAYSLGIVVSWAYAPIMMARTNGQTVGHRVTSTRIVHLDGTPMTGGRAFVREVATKSILFEIIGGLACSIPTLLNYLWPLWDDRDEALHDKLCKTRVVEA